MTDYVSILSRAVASLESDTAQSRATLYQRARGLLIDNIERDGDRWTEESASRKSRIFDVATDRIESDHCAANDQRLDRRYRQSPHRRRERRRRSMRFRRTPAATSAASSYLARSACSDSACSDSRFICSWVEPDHRTKAPSGKGAVATALEAAQSVVSRPSLDGDDLEPGVDGGSSDTGLPYYLRRQAVYYRSVYTAGMIVVDRSQRFLYLVQPQAEPCVTASAWAASATSARAYRIKSKSSQWPEWTPSPPA